MSIKAKRGRPTKRRPRKGDPIVAGMSQRDVAAALGTTRRTIAQMIDLASIPHKEFEREVEAGATIATLQLLARGRAGKAVTYERKCPHCGGLLRIEGM